jgi:L-fuculose-phosphate aldolase
MTPEERELREQICDVGRNLWQQQMVAANDGNITARLSTGEILCTPASVSKGSLTPEKITKVAPDGEVLDVTPPWRPSSELRMHLRVYAADERVGAIVHAHPMFGTVFAVRGEALTLRMLPESVIHMPEIPLAPYATPSTDALGEVVVPFVRDHHGCLLEQHGALTWGSDLTDAYLAMERLEYTARINYLLRLVGGARELPEDAIETLIGLRPQYGR